MDLAAAPSSGHCIAVLITVKSGAEPESYSASGARSGSGGSRSGSYKRTAPHVFITQHWYLDSLSLSEEGSCEVAAWSVA